LTGMCLRPNTAKEAAIEILVENKATTSGSTKRTRFVPMFKAVGFSTLVCVLGLAGLGYAASVRLFADNVAHAISLLVIFIALCLWMRLYAAVTWWLLFTQEHPASAAATMAEDADRLDIPSAGGKGRSAVVVGGGISGLSTAHYLLHAGFASVTLLEGRDKAGGNNEPYVNDKQEHATTCVFTSPSQQPHYAELCRQLEVSQTSHELQTVDGAVVLGNKSIAVRMGGNNEVYRFLRCQPPASSAHTPLSVSLPSSHPIFALAEYHALGRCRCSRAFWQVSWSDLFDGLTIFCLLYYAVRSHPPTLSHHLLPTLLRRASPPIYPLSSRRTGSAALRLSRFRCARSVAPVPAAARVAHVRLAASRQPPRVLQRLPRLLHGLGGRQRMVPLQ
jgi:hypothetical protein